MLGTHNRPSTHGSTRDPQNGCTARETNHFSEQDEMVGVTRIELVTLRV